MIPEITIDTAMFVWFVTNLKIIAT